MTETGAESAATAMTQAHATRGARVLVVSPQPFYSDRGTPIAVLNLLRALSDLGHQVDLLTYPIGRDVDIPNVRCFRVPNPLRLRSVPVGFSLRKLWLDLFVGRALWQRLRETRYDCVHAVEEASTLALVAAKRFGVPVVYDMQSSLAEQMRRRFFLRNRFAGRLLKRWERWVLSGVSYVAASAGLAERVRRLCPEARVFEWRYPSPVHQVTSEEIARLRSRLAIASGRPVVLYTGTFEAYQGLPVLVAAMERVLKKVPGAVLVLVGAGGTRGLNGRIGKVPADAIRVLEREPRESMASFRALADVLISPRVHGDNLPLKVFEYLSAGRAIVATSIPAHRSVLNDETALLVEPTPHGIADGIVELLENADLRRRLGSAASSYAARELNWGVFVRSVDKLYGEVVARVRV